MLFLHILEELALRIAYYSYVRNRVMTSLFYDALTRAKSRLSYNVSILV